MHTYALQNKEAAPAINCASGCVTCLGQMWQKTLCQESEYIQAEQNHFTKTSKSSQQLGKGRQDPVQSFEDIFHLRWAHTVQQPTKGLKPVAEDTSPLSILRQRWGGQQEGKFRQTALD